MKLFTISRSETVSNQGISQSAYHRYVDVTNNGSLSPIRKRFPAELAPFFIGYSITGVRVMFETIEELPRASGKSTTIVRSCEGLCAVIGEEQLSLASSHSAMVG